MHYIHLYIHTIQGSQKILAAAVISMLIIFFTAGNMIFMVVGICASLVSLHAIFHIAPSETDMDKSHRDSDENDGDDETVADEV
jgi:hypothetical protein